MPKIISEDELYNPTDEEVNNVIFSLEFTEYNLQNQALGSLDRKLTKEELNRIKEEYIDGSELLFELREEIIAVAVDFATNRRLIKQAQAGERLRRHFTKKDNKKKRKRDA